MPFARKRIAWLFAFLVLGYPAEAQFKGMPEAIPAMPAAPMAMPAPMTPDTTAAIPTTTPTMMVPGCPDRADCPPQPGPVRGQWPDSTSS